MSASESCLIIGVHVGWLISTQNKLFEHADERSESEITHTSSMDRFRYKTHEDRYVCFVIARVCLFLFRKSPAQHS